MKLTKIAVYALAGISLAACTTMSQRDRLVDPQTWSAKPGASTTKNVNEAIDHCYMVYVKGRNLYQAEQAFKEYRRCMDVAGYQEKTPDQN